MFVLLDSNVWLSHLARDGYCRRVVEAAESRCTFVTSAFICTEVQEKLVSRFGTSEAKAARLVAELKAETFLSEPATIAATELRDPEDLPVLAAAVAAKCALLVTGDKDLLVLKEFSGVEIVTAREFASRLGLNVD